jgi:hypothetical protein
MLQALLLLGLLFFDEDGSHTFSQNAGLLSPNNFFYDRTTTFRIS